MSGFLLGHGPAAKPVTASARDLCFTPDTQLFQGTVCGWAWAVSRVDDPALWAPAVDESTGVTVLLGGRISLEEPQWQEAEGLPYTGGLAARWILSKWLKDGESMLPLLNGAASVIILDARTEDGFSLITDRLGVFPVYTSTNGPALIGTHPDILASFRKQLGLETTLDVTSVAEVLRCGQASQPFTYWNEVHQIEPAWLTQWIVNSGEQTGIGRPWWNPDLENFTETSDQILIDDLATALTAAVRRRTNKRLGKPVVMLSGGADSRCALLGAQDPSQIQAFTLCDEPNEEVRTAQALARAAGAAHTVVKRDPDAYGIHAAESLRIAGGVWNMIDAHYGSLNEALSKAKPGVILTGCYADYMFKGLGIDRKYRLLFGRTLPLFDLADFNWSHYHPHAPLSKQWQQAVQARLENRIPPPQRESSVSARLRRELNRLSPLSREPDCSGRLWLWRTQPWDPFLSDLDVFNVFCRMSPEQKSNGILFGKAVDLVCGPRCRHIHNNNYGTPVGASEAQRSFWFLWAVLKRKISRFWKKKKQWGDSIATTGSWPDWAYFFKHSPTVTAVWNAKTPAEQEFFTELLGADPWSIPQSQWSEQNSSLFSRLVSFLVWSRQTKVLESGLRTPRW